MKVEQSEWTKSGSWQPALKSNPAAQLVLVFASGEALEDKRLLDEIARAYPGASRLGCSTAGEIFGTKVNEDSLTVTAVEFEHSRVQGAQTNVSDSAGSFEAGERLVRQLPKEGLAHVLVLSDGIKVNGSELVRGMAKHLPPGVQVTGGLSGDGARFQRTLVLYDGEAAPERIAALGFYGNRLRVGYGSLGGWDPFGPERRITRSRGNVLFELDEQPALALYKRYLGEHAAGLPSTGLLFPLSIRTASEGRQFVRTILAVDEKEQSMTFAGDIPQGDYARLMKANFDRLVDGAHGAALASHRSMGYSSTELALLISCIGRKLVLKQRTEEELEAVREVVGDGAVMTGFYSYGEICPAAPRANCELHNQTMTITLFSER